MKRFALKRLNILNKPIDVHDIDTVDAEAFEDKWLIAMDKMEAKRARKWRQQLSS